MRLEGAGGLQACRDHAQRFFLAANGADISEECPGSFCFREAWSLHARADQGEPETDSFHTPQPPPSSPQAPTRRSRIWSQI
jgi:hypothetical protein